MSPEQDRVLLKTLDAWRLIRVRNFKKSKREGVDKNRLKSMQHRNHWTSVAAIVNASRDTVLPRLKALTEQKSLSAGEKIEYFELLMFALIVACPCRPGTYYSAYVLALACAYHMNRSIYCAYDGVIVCAGISRTGHQLKSTRQVVRSGM